MYTITINIPELSHTVTAYSDGNALTALAFDVSEPCCPDGICKAAHEQLSEYFEGKRRDFSLPYIITGGEFLRAVLLKTRDIPYGKTTTYGQIALAAGHKGAARAVGSALSKNPLPIIIPCHRILPASGKIGNYYGGRLNDVKKYLLRLEGMIC